MDTENVVYTYNAILFSLKKKEGNSTIWHNMYEIWEHYSKWNMQVTERLALYDSTFTRYLK